MSSDSDMATPATDARTEIAAYKCPFATELAHHTKAIIERLETLRPLLEELRTLPDRLKRLEEVVFVPKPKRSRRVARSSRRSKVAGDVTIQVGRKK